MNDLTERLRSPMNVFYHHDVDDGALLREAADRIVGLESEVERLKARLNEAVSVADHHAVQGMVTQRQVKRLRARNVQIEAALRLLLYRVQDTQSAAREAYTSLTGEGDQDE